MNDIDKKKKPKRTFFSWFNEAGSAVRTLSMCGHFNRFMLIWYLFPGHQVLIIIVGQGSVGL